MGISRGWRPRLRALALFACAATISGCGFATLGSIEKRDLASPGSQAALESHPTDPRETEAPFGNEGPKHARVAVIVTRAIEGDTVDISTVVDGLSTVRLIGVDTPSPDQPHGDEAREFAASKLVDKEVILEFDAAPVDRYGRLLAYAHLPDGRMFNEMLVEKGHAQVATFPPNTRHADVFRDVQATAREDGLGLWSLKPEDLCRQTDRGNGIGGGCPAEPPPAPESESTVAKPTTTKPQDPETPEPPVETVPPSLPSVSPVAKRVTPAATLVGAGDVADCTGSGDEATARLLSRIGGTVFTLGDNAQDAGAAGEFANCYDPSWGRFKARTKPAVGNHEYATEGAAPYYDYFGSSAGRPGEGFYSYDRGAWHVVVLNSNCEEIGGCGPGSPQLEWLKRDLDANPSRCTLAYFHHPLFSSGRGVETDAVLPFWRVLYRRGAELVLNGHAHSYERFAPQTPDGARDPERGIRQLVVGTGGEPPRGPLGTPAANSIIRGEATPGVLKLDLAADSYKWRFLPVAGKNFTDSGAGRCH